MSKDFSLLVQLKLYDRYSEIFVLWSLQISPKKNHNIMPIISHRYSDRWNTCFKNLLLRVIIISTYI